MSDTSPKRTLPKRAHLATYHPVQVTARWAALVAAMQAVRTNSPASDAARDAQRKRETTYARGVKGAN